MYSVDICLKDEIIKSKQFDFDALRASVESTLNTINDQRLIKIIRVLPTVKPIIKFRTLYYLLDEFKGNSDLTHEFDVMRRFIGCDFDVFMFVNHLKKQKKNVASKE